MMYYLIAQPTDLSGVNGTSYYVEIQPNDWTWCGYNNIVMATKLNRFRAIHTLYHIKSFFSRDIQSHTFHLIEVKPVPK